MPVTPTYPGVYLNELPNPVHTITGVPTSIAAFVGPAARGQVGVPTQVNSWADFERAFGGLSGTSEMTYGVYQFFLNGGSQAVIVRADSSSSASSQAAIKLVGDLPTPDAKDAKKFLALQAISPGAWGNSLQVTITATPTLGGSVSNGSSTAAYNLTIVDGTTGGATETYVGVKAVANDPMSLDVQLRSSALVELYPGSDTTQAPGATTAALTPAANGVKGADGGTPSLDDLTGAVTTALATVDIFNILCVPDAVTGVTDSTAAYTTFVDAVTQFCVDRRAMLLVDPPATWKPANEEIPGSLLYHDPRYGQNAAFYYPRVSVVDPLNGAVRNFGPSGTIAGVYASTDGSRGVWKAPAGTAASLSGVVDLQEDMNDARNGDFNQVGVNCLRNFPIYGPVSWGARTANGADQLADQWKYVPVRRTALFIEESLVRGTKWVVFEPNDEPLWASIRLNVGTFMNGLFRQGAFQGSTPQEAYLVKCDAENNPQSQIDLGIVNILVGFAPLKPAEFVIINIQQLTGDLSG